MKATRLQSMPALIRARSQGKRVGARSLRGRCWMYTVGSILIRPGTDGALALAMMAWGWKKNLADRGFLAHRTRDERSERLFPHTPLPGQKGDRHPAEVIADLAKEYASAAAPAIILGSGPSRYGNEE